MEDLKRDGSPLHFVWEEDHECKSKLDLLDPFLEGSEHSLGNDEPLDFSQFPRTGKPVGQAITRPTTITMDSRKRSSGSQLSDPGSGIISRRRKKPKGMPKRPLSAYNLFFQAERSKVLEIAQQSGERISFEGLGKIIGKRWQQLTHKERQLYDMLAIKDTDRYRQEMEIYNDSTQKLAEEEETRNPSVPVVEVAVMNKRAPQSERRMVHSSQLERDARPAAPPAALKMIKTSKEKECDRLHNVEHPLSSSPFHAFTPQAERSRAEDLAPCPASVPASYTPSTSNPHLLASHNFAMPPPPQNVDVVSHPNTFHMPPGMEIVLSDRSGQERKYRVQYSCYSMTRQEARKYIDTVSGAQDVQQTSSSQTFHQNPQHYVPMQQQQQQHNLPGMNMGWTMMGPQHGMGGLAGPPHQ